MKTESKTILRDKDKLREIYQANGIHYTAQILEVGKNTVRRWLDKHKIVRVGLIRKNSDKAYLNRRKPTTFLGKGYRYIREPGKRERPEHRIVIEKKIGRRLHIKEVVHHIDFDRLNNELNNLVLCENQSEHQALHASADAILMVLIRAGHVGFDRKKKVYFLSVKNGGK